MTDPYWKSKDGMIELLCGDNCETLRTFESESVDLFVTSPPYDNLKKYGGHSWNFESVASELLRTLKVGGVIVWIVGDASDEGSETGSSFKQALHFKEIGLRIHDTMIWNKGGFSDVGSTFVRYGQVFEYMFILSKGQPKTFNRINDRKNKHAGTKLHGTIDDQANKSRKISNSGDIIPEYGIRFNIWNCHPEKRSEHPAPFPEQLVMDHIHTWSNEGDIVVDPFSGSGTTMKAAYDMGRRGRGIEINPEYHDMAVQRLKSATVMEKLF